MHSDVKIQEGRATVKYYVISLMHCSLTGKDTFISMESSVMIRKARPYLEELFFSSDGDAERTETMFSLDRDVPELSCGVSIRRKWSSRWRTAGTLTLFRIQKSALETKLNIFP